MSQPGHGSPRTAQLGAETPQATGLSAVDPMPLVIAGRYRVHRLLKEENGISTFLAHDNRDERPVVVKTTPVGTLSTAARLRLEHETSVVSALHSPVPDGRVVAWRDDDTAYLVQPFVAGVPLDQRLLDGPLPAADTLLVARELLSTLERVHGQGVLHRDIKPANVILDPGSPPEWAVLIDFGLARSSRLPASAGDLPAGTAGFVSPEQAGLTDAHVDERADLYSVGALLFTCLAGRPPFDGPGTPTGPPPSLASLGRSVPAALEALVQRLLRRDPAERYQSAAAARADADEIAQALAAGDEDPRVRIGAHDQRRSLTEPAFVGRAVELAALGRQMEETGSGHGGLVLVEAESGGGKTRLLEELTALAEQRGCWILGGQGLDQSGQRPFQTLEGVAAGVLEGAADSRIQERLRRRVGDHAEAIVAALPELAAVLGFQGGRGGDRRAGGEPGAEPYGEAGSLQALHALLDALGSPERPAVVILDDCQWADPLTAKLVARRQAASGVPGGHVTVVAAFRSDEAGDALLLADLKPRLHLRLAPLEPSEIGELVQSMAGPLPRAAVDTVIRLSEGSPFMAAAVLRGMVECGALVGSRDAWELDPVALRGVQASRRAAAFLLRRMDLLSPAALALLSVGAVLGKDFDLALAVALTGQDAASAVPALAEARARRILWVQEDGSRCVFFHDKLREALLERMAPEERGALHLQAAERIETTDPGRVFELARHFDAAGAAERALPYALEAARQAQAEHSLGLAEAHYRIAARAAATGTDEAKRAAAEGLGEVLSLRGSYAEAREALRSARSLATTRRGRAELDWRLGEVDFRCGNLSEARTDLESALAELRRPAPPNHLLLVLALLWQVMVQAAHSLAPRLFLARRPGPMPDDEALAARVYSALASVHWFGSGRLASAWAHLRGLNTAERYPPGPELAQAWSEHAPAATMVPWPGRGIDYARRSLAIRTTLGDRRGQGRSLSSLGVALYAASDFRGAIESFQRASGLLDRTADRWEANAAAWHIAMGHYRLGELSRAAELAEQTYWRAMEIGDRAASGVALSAWSRATGGRIPAALAAAALAVDTGDAHTTVELLVAEGVRLLHDGLPGDAAAAFGRAADVVRSAGLRQEYVAPVRPWLATALRAEAESCEAFAPGRRRSLLRRARRAARRGARTARAYRNNLPHALRELALAEMMLGSSRKAAALIEKSLRVAEQQSARYEHAQSLAARGRMGRSAGWPQAEADLAAGEEALAAILEPVVADGGAEAPMPAAADRFPGMTEAGRGIAAAASTAAVHEAAREAALHLLRGETCRFVDASGDGDALVRQAVAQGRPVTDRVNGPFGGSAEGGLEPAGIRPAVCAPIEVDGTVVECLYVTRGRNGGLFGPEEERLAAFIAALAGAALEHLASTEARFASLLEHSRDVVAVVDGGGSIQYQSSSAARVFGLRPRELLGTPVVAWVHPDDAEEVSARLHRLASGAAAGSVESRLRHADGSWRPVEITFANLLQDPGVRGIVLNVRDLTEQASSSPK